MDMPAVMATIASASSRPKYAYMLLQLLAEVADERGSAGPNIRVYGGMVAVRDWLCDALAPMAQRAPRRRSTVEAVRSAMEKSGELPANPEDAEQLIDDRIREQVRRPGRCNVSRAVSDLCRAGLLRRHYQGYRLDHKNRGAQREAVYTIMPDALRALRGR